MNVKEREELTKEKMLIPINHSNIECYYNLSQHYEAEFSPMTGKKPNEKGLYDITPIDSTHPGYLLLAFS